MTLMLFFLKQKRDGFRSDIKHVYKNVKGFVTSDKTSVQNN
jgi:hypothetical protein